MESKINWVRNSPEDIVYTFYFVREDEILNKDSNELYKYHEF